MGDSVTEPERFPKQYRADFEPHPDIVRECERLLEEARNGRLRAFAVALVYHDDLVPGGEVNRAWVMTPGTAWALDTSINRMLWKWRRHEYGDDQAQPIPVTT